MQKIYAGLKIFLSLFCAILIPTYWIHYGPQNFLWYSDIGLFLTVAALWLHSSLLMSIAALAVLSFEIAWNVDFFVQLITGSNLLTIAHYMFDPQLSLFLKSLSLFHIFIPIIWLLFLGQWGYNKRALGMP